MALNFHETMMRALDVQVMTAGKGGYGVPPSHYYAMRKALRKATMRGLPLRNAEELARATAVELARESV